MDSVNAFNLELFTMIDMKPPISRAKMMSVTKSAIKAIKLYKHVVQIVEKFIKKCKPELKVPGLYVVDSIVRQSRHQFGVDKDVYGPRFQKNFTPTFQNLYLCPHDDKSKIIRVLNLWQKNAVFEMDVVQPLLDMATGSFVLTPSPQEDLQAQPPVSSASFAAAQHQAQPPVSSASIAAAQHQAQPTVSIAAAQPPVSSAFVAAAQAQPPVSSASIAAAQLQPPVFIAAAQHQPPVSIAAAQHQPPVSIAAALPQLPPQLRNPEALAAVAQLFQSGQGHELQKMLLKFQSGQQTTTLVPNTMVDETQTTVPNTASDQTRSQRVQGQHNTHHPLFDTHHTHPAEQNNSLAKKLLDRFDYDDEPEEVKKEELDSLVPGNVYGGQFPVQTPPNMEQQFQGHMMGQPGRQQTPGEGYPGLNKGYNQSQHTAQQNQDQGNPREREDPSGRRDGREGRQRGHGRRSRSRSGSRSPRRKRSRSNSRSRKPRHSSQRSGSRSRESRWNSPRSRSQERKEREKDKDRRQKGLPSIKSQTLSVCTTTLWVGQLDKKTSRQDVMCLLEEFGQIDSINMIPPRGCAYIVMVHRQDAYRALHKLGRGSFKVNQKAIKIAWALNKGIKATHKKFWDVERGVTYIPWSKVKIEELEGYREGGMLDADTLCPEWGDDVKELTKPGGLNNGGGADAMETEGAATAHVQVPPVQPIGSMGGPSGFPGPPPSLTPGGPPLFLPAGFNPTQPPGFPHAVVGGPGSTKDDSGSKDKAGGSGGPSDTPDIQLGAPGPGGPGALMSPPGPGVPGALMSPPGPAVLLGPRPAMLPMQPRPGLPPPHLQPHFPLLPPPNMPPMMMGPRGPNPMFPPGGALQVGSGCPWATSPWRTFLTDPQTSHPAWTPPDIPSSLDPQTSLPARTPGKKKATGRAGDTSGARGQGLGDVTGTGEVWGAGRGFPRGGGGGEMVGP
ncbi:LOW QUALITY PROTEIN: SR-related and CTD-associated factor 4 [Oncorhynchus tshawytscha]|uniref:LOW QUALITY PROTEIN: SR-related and CTD-associated factor 4 n=1 Tax=Oncorhynchus tshawytscha TaxID=74940 RepID=UPI001C3CCF36|nr:LOW QUALITY PROTEIN: SR-related and CTD-associated factor 4 [Oncorhynchus tshawytscha]